MGHSHSLTRYSGGERMAAWTFLSTGSPHTWTRPVSPLRAHHPRLVKRGVVRCFHNRARGIINMQDNLQKKVNHLAKVLKQNGYPASFIRNGCAPPHRKQQKQAAMMRNRRRRSDCSVSGAACRQPPCCAIGIRDWTRSPRRGTVVSWPQSCRNWRHSRLMWRKRNGAVLTRSTAVRDCGCGRRRGIVPDSVSFFRRMPYTDSGGTPWSWVDASSGSMPRS